MSHSRDDYTLRWATPADLDAVHELYCELFIDPGQPTGPFAAFARDLLETHPRAGIERTAVALAPDGSLAAAVGLIPLDLTYAGLPVPAAEIGPVGTRAEHRRRGLASGLIAQVHAAAEGLMTIIEGIPHFYRRYGYEMAVSLNETRRVRWAALPAVETEPVTLRPAGEADLPDLLRFGRQNEQRSLLATRRGAADWRWELTGRRPDSEVRLRLQVVVSGGETVGLVAAQNTLEDGYLPVRLLELDPGLDPLLAFPSILRQLRPVGQAVGESRGLGEGEGVAVYAGPEHPVQRFCRDLLPDHRGPYAWYIRTPALPAFLRHIAPVLDARLATSELASTSATLTLTNYATGWRLVVERGQLVDIAEWPGGWTEADARFPDRTLLQAICGWRSIDELVTWYPDAAVRDDRTRALLDTWFPPRGSTLWPVI